MDLKRKKAAMYVAQLTAYTSGQSYKTFYSSKLRLKSGDIGNFWSIRL